MQASSEQSKVKDLSNVMANTNSYNYRYKHTKKKVVKF